MPTIAFLMALMLVFYLLGVQLGMDTAAIVPSAGFALLVALSTSRAMRPREQIQTSEGGHFVRSLETVPGLEVVRDSDPIALLLQWVGISWPRRQHLRAGGANLAEAAPSPG